MEKEELLYFEFLKKERNLTPEEKAKYSVLKQNHEYEMQVNKNCQRFIDESGIAIGITLLAFILTIIISGFIG